MAKGYMYILRCCDGSYYTGSTKYLLRRLAQHQAGEGANYTRKHLPVELIYFEEYDRIDHAFNREKQVQGWSRKKKDALIFGSPQLLPVLSVRYGSPTAEFLHSLDPASWPKTSQTEENKRTNPVPRRRRR